jgi:hypothetical protein
LRIELFAKLARRDRSQVEDEGARLLAFAAADTTQRDVRFGELSG